MRAPPVAVLLVLPLLLAGCFGGGGEVETADTPEANGTPTDPPALPDGRGTSAGSIETNKTEEGVGGVDHKHDYWEGQDTVMLYQDDITLSIFPTFPDGPGTTPKGVAYVKLPPGRLVYEGAEKVTVLVGTPEVAFGLAEDPSPAGLNMQVRTAADTDWRPAVPITYGTPLDIPVSPKETDMPHSTTSLWVFRLVAERGLFSVVNVTITTSRGGDVVDWPGHPDFYADNKTHRVVMDSDVTTHINGFPENMFYENPKGWAAPTFLISHGTKRLEIWANVSGTTATSPTAAEPVSYVLNWHNASKADFEGDIFNYVEDAEGKNDLKSYHFRLEVDEGGMDGPYQPSSRWGFRLEAGYGNDAATGLPIPFAGGCTDCASYDVSYHLTIIAYPTTLEEATGGGETA